ncbi:MAG: hypothetical protein NTV80_23430 [Verrucomicrobia bacterium]|nr:hypothetical protein [Verrucomicrobiota bacterium]
MKLSLFSFLVCLGCIFSEGVQAGVTPTVSSWVRTDGYTGLLVYADSITGHVPNQSKISGSWAMDFAWDGLDALGMNFESTMWFEDDAGVKVPIIPDGGGPAVTEIVEEYQVSLNAQTTTDIHVFSATFRPQSRLSPQKRYTMKAKWRSRVGNAGYANFFLLVPQHVSAPNTRLYLHYDNFTSGDAALNARTLLSLNSWTRQWMIASSATQGSFLAQVEVSTVRFDDFDVAATSAVIHSVLSIALKRVSTGAVVWSSSGQQVSQVVFSHAGGTGAVAEPSATSTTVPLAFTVPEGVLVQGEEYIPILSVTHNDVVGGPTTAVDEGARAFEAQRLLRFSGKIFFGSLLTYGNEISNDPVSDLYPNALPLPTSTLAVVPGQGTLPEAPGATYGGTPLAVEIDPNGDAHYGDGTQIPVTAATTAFSQGVKFTRTGVYLKTTGAKAASMTVHLPRGMGYTYTAGSRVMKSKITVPDMPLQSNLLPTGMAAFLFNVPTYVSLERLPLVFATSGVNFTTATCVFSFIPTSVIYENALELGTIETYATINGLQWPANTPLHAGNDQVFRTARILDSTAFEVKAGSDGAAFIRTLKVGFNPGAWWTHFPQHWLVVTSSSATQTSIFRITDDVVDQNSVLNGVQAIFGSYSPDPKPEPGKPDCPSGTPKAGPFYFVLRNQEERLTFLADGSLDGTMRMEQNAAPSYPLLNDISWGTFQATPVALFAHQLSLVPGTGITGNVMLPSHYLTARGSEVAGLSKKDRAAAVHLSGRGFGSGGTQVEYPHQAAYQTGAADYAGMNLRKAGQGLSASCRLGGGLPFSYPLLNESKLYLRSGGVSGMIQSSENIAFPINGFDFSFDGMKLAFLDNCVAGSKLDGGVQIGGPAPSHPSNFNVTFQNLKLWSNGALNQGEVDPTQPSKNLAYWRTNLVPMSMNFVQPDACTGADGETFLALGVQTVLPAIAGSDPLHGIFGFRNDGTLVTKGAQTEAEFAITQLDSRLRVPGDIKIKAPGSSNYSLAPVCGAYLNDWPGAGGSPSIGFASIAGAVDVPFFENLTVHMHATADSNASVNASVHVMQPPTSLGPFTLAEFDPRNSGVPSINNVPLVVTTYRDSPDYRVHAKKKWLGLVNFDFPLKWVSTQRRFEMSDAEATTQSLLIADVKGRVRSLTPTTADLKFRADFGVQLPSVDANALIGQALEGVGIGSPLSAITSQVPGFGTMLSDLANFEQALADTPEKLVRQPLLEAVAQVRASLPPNASAASFKAALISQLNGQFNLPATSASVPTSWKQPVMTRLDKVNSISANLKSYIFNAATVVAIADALAQALGGQDSSNVPPEVQETLDTAYGALSLIQSGIAEVRTGINAISITPSWSPIIDQTLPDLPMTPLSVSNAEIVDALSQRFLGDTSAAKISEKMRVHLSDVQDRLRGSMDAIFAGVNEMIQGEAGNVLPTAVPGIADLADLKFGKIDGQARINGDSLHELRLDADMRLSIGSDLDFHGYVYYRDLQSDTPGNICRTSAGVAAELTLGASTKFSFGAPPSPTELAIEAKFAFGASGGLNGLAGRFGVQGSGFKLGVLTIQQAELGFGFGGGDGYLYGKGAGRSDWADIEAAVFLGRTCDLNGVMQRVDAKVNELLNQPQVQNVTVGGSFPAYGLYAFGYGSISVNALIGIPPSPMLNLKAGAGMGAFYFVREQDAPPSPDERYAAVIGLRQDMGVSGEVLCLADISARLSLVGATVFNTDHPANLLPILSDPLSHPILGNGKADVSLEVGVSPFDFTLHKTLRMNFSYSPLKFDLDL